LIDFVHAKKLNDKVLFHCFEDHFVEYKGSSDGWRHFEASLGLVEQFDQVSGDDLFNSGVNRIISVNKQAFNRVGVNINVIYEPFHRLYIL
jgi:hypothetical protein